MLTVHSTPHSPSPPRAVAHTPEQSISRAAQQQPAQDAQAMLEAAKRDVEGLVASAKTSGEVEAHFPRIRQQYGVRHIGFNEKGEIYLKINPEATVSSSNRLTWTGGNLPSGDRTTQVRYSTASLGGSTVGVSMEADPIGPNHPQGGPPKTSAQTSLMSKLVTDIHQSAENKYVRGHLLNDNIGGPGEPKNLYPITGSANKKHHDEVESTVKDWVNNRGYWVYYKVEVDEKAKDLSHSNIDYNYVDANFKCHAYPLAADGSKANQELTKTIRSEYEVVRSSRGNGLEIDMRGTAPAVDTHYGSYDIQWSKSKRTAHAAINTLDTDIDETLQSIYHEGDWHVKQLITRELGGVDGIGKATIKQVFDYLQTKSHLKPATVRRINERLGDVLAAITDAYFQLEDEGYYD